MSAAHARSRASVRGPKRLLCRGTRWPRKHHGALAALTLSLVLLAVTTLSCIPTRQRVPPTRPSAGAPTRTAHRAPPNIILITTDDQNVGELRWMPRTRRELAGHGVLFTRALSPDPLCCPARAEIVTGQLGQNNGVSSNLGLHGGFSALRGEAEHPGRLAPEGRLPDGAGGQVPQRLHRPGRATARLDPVEPLGRLTSTATAHDVLPGRQPANLPQERDPRHRALRAAVRPGVLRHAASLSSSGPRSSRRTSDAGTPAAPALPPLPTRRHRHDLEGVRAPSLAKPTFGTDAGSAARTLADPAERLRGRPCSHCSPAASSRCRTSTPPSPG